MSMAVPPPCVHAGPEAREAGLHPWGHRALWAALGAQPRLSERRVHAAQGGCLVPGLLSLEGVRWGQAELLGRHLIPYCLARPRAMMCSWQPVGM